MSTRLPAPLAAFAQALAQARRDGRPLAQAPHIADAAEAMATQAETVRLMGERRVGWKVAIHPAAGPVAAPLLAGATWRSGEAFHAPADFGVEVEIAVRMARDLAPGDHSREAIGACVDAYCVGVELVGSRLTAGASPFLPFLADSLANIGYATGDWRAWSEVAVTGRRCLVRLEEAVLFDAPCEEGHGDPLLTLRDALRGEGVVPGGFKAGEVVTTGSRCGVVRAPRRAGRLVCAIEGLGSVETMLR